MGGCDQGKLESGQSCNGADGPGGMSKDRWIRLEEKGQSREWEKHEKRPGSRN